MREDDAFATLGLKADASVTDVKAAYRGLGKIVCLDTFESFARVT